MAEDPQRAAAPNAPLDVATPVDARGATRASRPGGNTDPALNRRVRLLVLCGTIAFSASTALNVALELWTSAGVTAALSVLTASMWLLWQPLLGRVSVRAVAHGTLGACVLAIALIAFGEGTTRTPNLHFFSLIVVASALLLGVRASRFWTVASILAAALTYGADVRLRGANAGLALNHCLGLAIVLVVLHLLASAAWRVAATSLTASEEAAERARAAAIDLEVANTALGAAMQARSRFLANMSHEIRTPLNAVLGFTDVLLGTPLDNDQRQYSETIRGAGQGLLVIVDDVLDLARIEAGKLGLTRETVDLRDSISTSLDMLAVAAHKKGLEIWGEIDEGAPSHVDADAARVRQVLLNLIGNAVKFTASGEVVVKLRRDPDSPSMARVEVHDTGSGIARNAYENLFQPFGQEDGSTRRRHGGTGLGLVISKKLIEGMGGRIGFTSEVGKGSCFWFDLPSVRLTPSIVQSIVGVKVVLVEGRASHGEQVARALLKHVREGVVRLPAGTSAAGVRSALGTATRAVVVVDWDPAAASPATLVTELAEGDDRVRGVILMAPLSEQASRRDRRWPARVAVLHKPVRVARLLQRMNELEREERPPPSRPPPPNRFQHRVLLVEDNAVNQTIGRLMLQAAGCSVRLASDGAHAVAALSGSGADVDLVLMDLHMPNMDGFEATRAIRDQERAAGRRPVPIVALSASVLQEDQERCLEVGMNGHLAKPISQQALEDLLRRTAPRS